MIEADGHISQLKYRSLNESTLDYYSTYVPDECRGQGLAQKLTQAALEYAQSRNLKVKPSCSFVARYIERHSEFADLLA